MPHVGDTKVIKGRWYIYRKWGNKFEWTDCTKRIQKTLKEICNEKIITKPIKTRLRLLNNPINGCAMGVQGKRPSMEDTHVFATLGEFSIYCVFDGHGGKEVSATLRRDLPKRLLKMLQTTESGNSTKIKQMISRHIIDYDKWLYNTKRFGEVGSTAIIVIKHKNVLYFVNLGDSRAVLFNKGKGNATSPKLVFSTNDHKPYTLSELNRIKKAGGFVSNKRVNGILALSRAFGDFNLKKKNGKFAGEHGPVSSRPTITVVKLPVSTTNYRLILACDGLWDVFASFQVAKWVRDKRITRKLCKDLIDSALKRGSTDNITVMIADL